MRKRNCFFTHISDVNFTNNDNSNDDSPANIQHESKKFLQGLKKTKIFQLIFDN